MDILKIATERGENLRREVMRLDEFIRMAESLIDGAAGEQRSAVARLDPARREQSK